MSDGDSLKLGDRVRNKNPRYRTAFVIETLEMTKGTEQQGRIGVHYEVDCRHGYVTPANLKKISRHKEAK